VGDFFPLILHERFLIELLVEKTTTNRRFSLFSGAFGNKSEKSMGSVLHLSTELFGLVEIYRSLDYVAAEIQN
jgi:hypothetical protein